MKILKITICYLILVLVCQFSSCTESDKRRLSNAEREQKHFLSLRANTLYLSKSLNSKEKIHLPFQRIFSLSTSLSSSLSKNLISFLPTSIKLSQHKHSKWIQFSPKQKGNQQQFSIEGVPIIHKEGNYSVFDDLRTPFPLQMNDIVVVSEKFIFLFIFPNKIVILQQIGQLISIKNTYFINQQKIKKDVKQQLTTEDYSFYPIGQSHVMGYIEGISQFILFDRENYSILSIQHSINNLQHIHSVQTDKDNLQFFTAQRQDGFKHCKINLQTLKIQIVQQFSTFDQIGFETSNENLDNKKELNIYDISFNQKTSDLYLLDKNLGVIKLFYNITIPQQNGEKLKIASNASSLIISQRGCQALDYIENDRFVLICQERKRRFFVQAYFSKTTNSFISEPPVFHNCYFDDLEITPQFYVAFQQTSVDVFWPSKMHFIPQLVHNKKHINLLGMQTFKIKSDKKGDIFLYSIRNNILVKQKISEEKYELKIGSSIPTSQSFLISTFGSCQTLFFNLNDKNNRYSMAFHHNQIDKLNNHMKVKRIQNDSENLLCQVIVPIQLQSSEYIVENRTKFAFAAGIFIICILIAFSLVCICLQKYQGMERKAKQVLRKLQSEKKSNPQFVL